MSHPEFFNQVIDHLLPLWPGLLAPPLAGVLKSVFVNELARRASSFTKTDERNGERRSSTLDKGGKVSSKNQLDRSCFCAQTAKIVQNGAQARGVSTRAVLGTVAKVPSDPRLLFL